MKPSVAQFLIMVVGGALVQGAAAAELENSFNFGIGGLNPMPHCEATVVTVEYERQITPAMVIVGRGSGVDYTDDAHDYLEEGKLRGLDLGLRYYHGGRMQGLYTGVSLGYWKNDWNFVSERDTINPSRGDAEFTAARLNIDIGYRYLIRDTNISIKPEVNLGKFFPSASCNYTAPAARVGTPCDQNSDVEGYLFAGVMVGVAF